MSQRSSESVDERLIAIVDAGLRIVLVEPRLSELLGSDHVCVGASLSELVDEPSRRALLLVAARAAGQIVLACPGDPTRSIVVRLAIAGDQTWLTLHERMCAPGRGRAPPIVGRRTELTELERYLVCDELSILYVRGPLGIGKSALLGAFAARLDELGCPYFVLDATSTEPTSDAVAAAILGGSSSASLATITRAAQRLGSRRWAIFVDNFDAWQDVAHMLADRPFRTLPVECRIIVAARRMPDSRWWDVAARTPRVMSIGVLPPEDAAELEARLSIPPEQREAVATRAKGHPLCIVTLADAVRSGMSPTQGNLPLGVDFARVGGRRLLETAAVPARITEDVLAAILDEGDDVTAAYDRLSAVAVRDPSGIGLRMPDVLREALRAGLRERSPALFASVQRRLLEHYGDVLEGRDVAHLYGVVDDFLDSFDDQPLVREVAGLRRDRIGSIRAATPDDRAAVFAAARRFLGDEAGVTALRRLDDNYAFTAIIEGPERIDGILQYVTPAVHELEQLAKISSDHELALAVEVLRRHPLPGPDERVLAVLGWLTPEVGRGRWDAASRALFRHVLHVLLSVPQPVATVFVQPSVPVPLPTAAFPGATSIRVDGRTVVYRNVRGLSTRRMLAAFATASGDRPPVVDGLVTTGTSVTVDVVRAALTDIAQPDRLVRSPLLSLRVVAAEAGPGTGPRERAEALVRVLGQTIRSLQGGPREQKQRRALEAVFLERSGKHETIAADLGLPYSTFRRYLARGIERVADALRLLEDGAR